ncbi:MAG: LysM peptidoglycan-binding domain-containing protein [Bacteroidota bacterium]
MVAQPLFKDSLQNDSIPLVIRPLLIVPAFQLINPDTLQLGEYDELICDSYSAMGVPYVYDALHSFHSRRMDKFGGYLNDKIDEGLRQIRLKGYYSDLKQLYIQINPKLLTVHWVAVVGPSTYGNCYVKVNSRGSAGGGRPAVEKQLPSMHRNHPGLNPVKVLEYNHDVIQCFDWRGNALDSFYTVVNIQQYFFKYADPRIGNSIRLEDYDLMEKENTVNSDPKPTVPVKSYARKYRVRAGDTLSGIAQKYHTSVAKIKKANGLRSDRIQIGQVLKIP